MKTREDILSLADCPFCGLEPMLLETREVGGSAQQFMIACYQCGIEMGSEDREDLVETWSRRAAPTPPAAEAPEGWWMAPRVPTAEMVSEAVYNVNRKYDHDPVDAAIVSEVWGSMKHARPNPPAAEAPGQEPVAVKLLEWFQYPDGEENWYSQDDLDRNLGLYTIRRDSEQADLWALIICGHDCGAFDTREEAIDVAQDDFETRVRSAIVSPPTYADAEAKGFERGVESAAKVLEDRAEETRHDLDWLTPIGAAESPKAYRLRAVIDGYTGSAAAIRSLASSAPKGET